MVLDNKSPLQNLIKEQWDPTEEWHQAQYDAAVDAFGNGMPYWADLSESDKEAIRKMNLVNQNLKGES